MHIMLLKTNHAYYAIDAYLMPLMRIYASMLVVYLNLMRDYDFGAAYAVRLNQSTSPAALSNDPPRC